MTSDEATVDLRERIEALGWDIRERWPGYSSADKMDRGTRTSLRIFWDRVDNALPFWSSVRGGKAIGLIVGFVLGLLAALGL